jgi:hypothetical protein
MDSCEKENVHIIHTIVSMTVDVLLNMIRCGFAKCFPQSECAA